MLNLLFRLFNKIDLLIFHPIAQLVARIYLSAAGVRMGKTPKLYGIPMVSLYPGSRIVIGDNVTLRSKSKGNAIGVNHEVILRTQAQGAEIIIGNRVGISGGAICAIRRVTIGDGTLIGANVVIADNDFHPSDPVKRKVGERNLESKEIIIGKNVWLGADTYICKGVSIGDNSVIGAKSVVTKSIPPNSVAVGVPAKVVKMLVAE